MRPRSSRYPFVGGLTGVFHFELIFRATLPAPPRHLRIALPRLPFACRPLWVRRRVAAAAGGAWFCQPG